MKEEIEILLETKNWSDLTEHERSFVLTEIKDEREYNQLRTFHFLSSDTETQLTANPAILKSLQKKFRTHHGKESFIRELIFYPVPGWATVVLFGLLVGGYLISNTTRPVKSITKVETITDTVFVASKPDTILIEKPVTRVVYKYLQTKAPVVMATKHDDGGPSGVSMKDKEELDGLLVSGTD